MAKKKIVCPECNHTHYVSIATHSVVTAGVRARRVTGNQFEYALMTPQEMIEGVEFAGVSTDMALTAGVSVAAALFGALGASLFADPIPALYVGGLVGSGGAVVAYGWLCAEYNQRLKRVLPWFIEQRSAWGVDTPTNEGVTLTVDHKYRDSFSESGRSIALLGVLPVPVEDFAEWSRCALRGDSLAIARWTPVEKGFSRQDYDNLLAKMRDANIVANLPGKGHKLTNPGRHALKAAIDSLPPSPGSERA